MLLRRISDLMRSNVCTILRLDSSIALSIVSDFSLFLRGAGALTKHYYISILLFDSKRHPNGAIESEGNRYHSILIPFEILPRVLLTRPSG